MKTIIPDLTTSYRYLYPRLTVLVSSGTVKTPNALTIAWSTPLSVNPPLIGIAITNTRYSHEIIKKNKDFVVNIPNINQVDGSYYIGQISGSEEPKKLQQAGFTLEASHKIDAPRIKECQINLECKLENIYPIGDHDLFVGRVVEVLIDPKIIDQWSFNLDKFQPIYWRQSKSKEETFTVNKSETQKE